ncbi:AMP-binding protein [Microbulbifer taiwanensis]|uniref:AMP-binding protein n=1 Tax=Microbulbifer taiwanensis TaxID=986746 RepID=UPI003A91E46B
MEFGSEQWSYDQLNRRANRLAHQLIELGVGPEVRVGIAAQRSLEMVLGLLAILKAGGAYVPLEPEYPLERLTRMIEGSGIELLLTQSHLVAQMPERGAAVAGAGHPGPGWRARWQSAGGAARGKPRLCDLHLRLHR